MCGIVGLIGTPEAAREAFLGLTTLQHRGQDGAGILTHDSDGFHKVKNIGLVESVFNRENMATLTGNIAVGHARYSTVGRGDPNDIQPFVINYPYGIGLVHNGNVVNYAALRDQLRQKSRRHLLTHSDTEVILNLLAEGLSSPSEGQENANEVFEDLCRSVKRVFDQVNGSFSIVALIADHGLLAFRDPHGIRPLIWGTRAERRANGSSPTGPAGVAHMVASESVALNFNGFEVKRNLEPGEVLFIDQKGQVHSRVLRKGAEAEPRHCMFEWVYFASPESVIDSVPVYGARIELGRGLAQLLKKRIASGEISPDVIVPVPETSRIAAIALAEELGLPYRELLIKNRYIKRTFILDSQDKRENAVNLKLSPVYSEIRGKKVLLVDDSIVRGTTSRKLIELVRKAGAEKVYFVSTCPPIQHPCYYGIDFPNKSELIAHNRSVEEIEKELGADGVVYLDHSGLKKALTLKKPCMACLDANYPTDIAAGAKMAEERVKDREANRQRG